MKLRIKNLVNPLSLIILALLLGWINQAGWISIGHVYTMWIGLIGALWYVANKIGLIRKTGL